MKRIQIQYKPGKENIVADALSRKYCNIATNESSFKMDSIPKSPVPLNFFKNQIEIERSSIGELKTETIFSGYVLHNIKFTNSRNLI